MTERAQGRESLADYVRRIRNSKNMSCRDVEIQSGRHGSKIAASYVSRIENEVATNPSKDKLIALANGLEVSEEELFAVARGRSLSEPSAMEETLLSLFRELPGDRQEDFLNMLRTLHRDRATKRTVRRKRPHAA